MILSEEIQSPETSPQKENDAGPLDFELSEMVQNRNSVLPVKENCFR